MLALFWAPLRRLGHETNQALCYMSLHLRHLDLHGSQNSVEKRDTSFNAPFGSRASSYMLALESIVTLSRASANSRV